MNDKEQKAFDELAEMAARNNLTSVTASMTSDGRVGYIIDYEPRRPIAEPVLKPCNWKADKNLWNGLARFQPKRAR